MPRPHRPSCREPRRSGRRLARVGPAPRAIACTLALAMAGCASTVGRSDDDARRLLAIHEQILQAHRDGDVEAWLALEGEAYVSANGGTVTFPTMAERRAARGPYLASTSFDVYRDLRAPIVEVSPDGQLGWVIAQVEIEGTRTAADSSAIPVREVWAWIELYRQVDGRWTLVGNISNRQR